jgi:glycosyltransferase involved in cell wall biosynthesis
MNDIELTVIIPAYNEAEAIGDVVKDLVREAHGVKVIVVDDGSQDDTAGAASAAGATVVRHRRNRGYGAAIKTGIKSADTRFVATYDADGQHRPADLMRLYEAAREHDVVIGARGKGSHQVAARRPGKWVLARTAETLVGQKIPDLNSGLRVMRRVIAMRYLHLLPNGFSASTTITVCVMQRGYDVEFVPITTRERVGKSTVKQFRDGLNTIYLIIRLIVLFNPTRFFLPPALAMIVTGLAYGFFKAFQFHRGFPVLALLLVSTGFITAMFGLLADQISSLRREMYEKDAS